MSDGSPRHLAAPMPLRRRWSLWTGVGLVGVLVLGAVVWAGTAGGARREADRGQAAAPPATASQSTRATATTTGVATTVAQASGDGPPNLLPSASFERS